MSHAIERRGPFSSATVNPPMRRLVAAFFLALFSFFDAVLVVEQWRHGVRLLPAALMLVGLAVLRTREVSPERYELSGRCRSAGG